MKYIISNLVVTDDFANKYDYEKRELIQKEFLAFVVKASEEMLADKSSDSD